MNDNDNNSTVISADLNADQSTVLDDWFAESKSVDIVFDGETADPDDWFTICFLMSHPKAKLRAVTLYPGSTKQIGLVKQTLRVADQGRTDVKVAGYNPQHPKESVSAFHFKVFPNIQDEQPDAPADQLIIDTIQQYPNCIIISGGPPFNIAKALKTDPSLIIKQWVAQGGFAGSNIVPEEYQLSKFKGLKSCVSANWGSTDTIDYLLSSDRIQRVLVVSKNVCHGVVYNSTMHKKVEKVRTKTNGLSLIYEGMSTYLDKRDGKKFHDPLAACAALNPSIFKWKKVRMCHEKREWWAAEDSESHIHIAICADRDLFVQTLTKYET